MLKTKNFEILQTKCGKFRREAQHISYVAACKCPPNSKCGCYESKKVPTKEVAFLADQRNERKMAIGSADMRFNRKLEKAHIRKSSMIAYHEQNQAGPSNPKAQSAILHSVDLALSPLTETSSITESGEDFSPGRYFMKSMKKKTRAKSKSDDKNLPKKRKFALLGQQ